jgi:5-methylcytosine-specific restriction endonuclease McrA
MQKWAEKFYKSRTWMKTRKAYMQSVGCLCERCRDKGIIKPGEMVHHIQFVTANNINDPSITLNWDNLQCLCRDCHAEMHKGVKRYKVDELGRVVSR